MANTNHVAYGEGNDQVIDYSKNHDLNGQPIVDAGGFSMDSQAVTDGAVVDLAGAPLVNADIQSPQVAFASAKLIHAGGVWVLQSRDNIGPAINIVQDDAAETIIELVLLNPVNTDPADEADALAALSPEVTYSRAGGAAANQDGTPQGLAVSNAQIVDTILVQQSFNAVGAADDDTIVVRAAVLPV